MKHPRSAFGIGECFTPVNRPDFSLFFFWKKKKTKTESPCRFYQTERRGEIPVLEANRIVTFFIKWWRRLKKFFCFSLYAPPSMKKVPKPLASSLVQFFPFSQPAFIFFSGICLFCFVLFCFSFFLCLTKREKKKWVRVRSRLHVGRIV